jgi:hypothetical protein
MTECVILYRVHAHAGEAPVMFIHNDDIQMAVFPHMDAAVDYCLNNEFLNSEQVNYQIVELDEL